MIRRLPRLAGAILVAGLLSSCATLDSWMSPKPAWERPTPLRVDAPVVKPGTLHRSVLDNGLTVLILEDARLPRVGIGVTLRRGAAMVEPERAGLASFTAELLERGAGDRDALELAEAVDALGATLASHAGWDSMSVGVAGLSRDLDALLGFLGDSVLRPRFDPAEATRVRDERLAGLERAKDDPSTLARWYLAKALYEGHRFGIPMPGNPTTVAELDASAAREFHRRVFLPNNAILAATGDVDPSALLQEIRSRFGAWESGDLPDPGPPPPAQVPATPGILIVDRPDLVQARIALGHEGIARTDDDRLATALMNSVIGGSGFSSRLMVSLRSEEGLTYGVGSGYSLRRSPGPFTVSTFTRVPQVRRALDLLLDELERGRSEPPGEDELSWARTLATGRFSMGLETSNAVARSLVDLDVYGLPEDSLDTYRARVVALTPEQVEAAAREHLHPDRAAIVLVGPAEALAPQVEDLGPVEILTP